MAYIMNAGYIILGIVVVSLVVGWVIVSIGAGIAEEEFEE